MSMTTATCTSPGHITINSGFYPASGGTYDVRVQFALYNVSTGTWKTYDWTTQQVLPGQTVNLEDTTVPSGEYLVVLQWMQPDGNGWSQPIGDYAEQVFDWSPDGFSTNTNGVCVL